MTYDYKKTEEHAKKWTEKTSVSKVIFESNQFSNQKINLNKSLQTLIEIVYLFDHSDNFSEKDKTDLFFGVTKLFQSNNPTLRRMVYLIIGSIKHDPENAFMAVSCLIKDLTSLDSSPLFKANAIKALSNIVDENFLSDINRFLSQSIISPNPTIQNAALLVGCKLLTLDSKTVSKWGSKASEAINSPNELIQLQAATFILKSKQNDKNALLKAFIQIVQKDVKSEFVACFLLEVLANLANFGKRKNMENSSNSERRYGGLNDVLSVKVVHRFLGDCLSDSRDSVAYGAVKVVLSCRIKNDPNIIERVVSIMKILLSLKQTLKKKVALKILNDHYETFKENMNGLKPYLQDLLESENKNIASMAVLLLFRSAGSSFDTLVEKVSSLMLSMTVDVKILLLKTITESVQKETKRGISLLNFLSDLLKKTEPLSVKETALNSIEILFENQPDLVEIGLDILCEFIEDCEHSVLTARILHLIGQKGPLAKTPSKYIRYIFNRITLELPPIRCAAVDALLKFGLAVKSLTESVISLLKKCLNDNDDEVRDRSAFNIKLIEENVDISSLSMTKKELLNLNYSVKIFLENDSIEKPFTENDIVDYILPEKETEQTLKLNKNEKATNNKMSETDFALQNQNNQKIIHDLPQKLFDKIGKFFNQNLVFFKKTEWKNLTESEFEYFSKMRKHIFSNGVVVCQIEVSNTLEDFNIENVSVIPLLEENSSFSVIKRIKSKIISTEDKEDTYIIFKTNKAIFSAEKMNCTLKFDYTENDKKTVSEFALESIGIEPKDFFRPKSVDFEIFKSKWLRLKNEQIVQISFFVKRADLKYYGKKLERELSLKMVNFTKKGEKSAMASYSGEFCIFEENPTENCLENNAEIDENSSKNAENDENSTKNVKNNENGEKMEIYARIIFGMRMKNGKNFLGLKASVRGFDEEKVSGVVQILRNLRF